MSDQKNIIYRIHCIEKLLSENNFQDIEDHLKELEDVSMTVEYLQGTEVAKVVYRILKSCPSAELKKKAKQLLSRWKALYKNNRLQSVQVKKSVSVCVSEATEHLEIPGEQLLSEGPCQQEVLDAVPSKILVPPQTVKKWQVTMQTAAEISFPLLRKDILIMKVLNLLLTKQARSRIT